MKIAYGKLGRSIPIRLDDVSNVGGDIEVVRLLHLLSQEHEVHLVGRNRADVDIPNVVNHWRPGGVFNGCPKASRCAGPEFDVYDEFLRNGIHHVLTEHGPFDATIFWLGQHGSSVHPVPAVQAAKKGEFTNPLLSDVNYGHPITLFVNLSGQAPIWVSPDPRNMIKFRDLWDRNQRTVMAQFNTSKANTFYDERDGKIRTGSTKYIYSGIELLAVDTGPQLYHNAPDKLFGILVNEGYNNLGSKGRCALVRQWTRTVPDCEIFGTWSEKSQLELNRKIEPVPFEEVSNTMRRWRSTITFPATASGWATAKPWEAFHAQCVCFAHPDYDSQNHIYSREHMPADLRSFLRLPTSSSLPDRLEKLKDEATWRDIVSAQRDYLRSSLDRLEGGMGIIKKALRGEV